MKHNPMATPAEDISIGSTKKKKHTNNGYVTNTVTVPPQPAHSTAATPTTKNYETPVPQPPKATVSSTGVKSSTVNNNISSAKTAVDAIQGKPFIYDSTPIPQTQLKTTRPQSYSSMVSVQNTSRNTVSKQNVPKTNHGPSREAAQSMQTATYQPQGSYNAQSPYTTNDRVTYYSTPKQPKVKQVVSQQPAVWGRTQTQTAAGGGWAVPKTIKDGAQPRYNGFAQPGSNIGFDYGINREIGGYTKTEDDTLNRNLKGLYIKYMKRMAGDIGINRQIINNTFLDHRGQNPVEKIMEKKPFDLSDNRTVVTKDNVYEQPKEVIEKELNKMGTFVNNELSKLKRQRENLLFVLQYGRIDSDDEQLQKINYDIQYLEHIEKKIELGA